MFNLIISSSPLLQRRPRYFDGPSYNSWEMCSNCGQEGHMVCQCTMRKWKKKKLCFLCGSLDHVGRRCRKVQYRCIIEIIVNALSSYTFYWKVNPKLTTLQKVPDDSSRVFFWVICNVSDLDESLSGNLFQKFGGKCNEGLSCLFTVLAHVFSFFSKLLH